MAQIKTLVELSSIKNAAEAATDKFSTHKTQQPFFMNITVFEPIVGGDQNGDGQVNDLDILKQLGDKFTQLASDATSVFTPQANLNRDRQGIDRASYNVATKTAAELAFPMPLELAYNEGVNWADDNSAASDLALAAGAQIPKLLGGAAQKSIVGTLLDAVSAQSALTAARKIGQKSFGIGLEPRKEMFFNGPEFREFQFSWEFSPKNATEAALIRDVINLLRKHKSPDRISEIGNAIGFEVWKLPSTFQISFRHGSEENKYLPKIKPCVISNISTNMMKDGNWRSFEDGAPIATVLSVAFKEVAVITQKDITDGY